MTIYIKKDEHVMKEILLGGFGGQGVLTAGTMIAEMAIYKGYNATWSPEYGSAMRGGTASCVVKFGEERIYSPEKELADVLLAMNDEILIKFADRVKVGGMVVINSDMVKIPETFRTDVKIIQVPCMTMAEKINHAKGANIIMCGVICKASGDFTEEEAIKGMNDTFRRKGKEKFEALNTAAMKLGFGIEV